MSDGISALKGCPGTISNWVLAGDDRRPGRSAKRADMKISQTQRFPGKSIEIWCLQPWITMIAQIANSLIIRHNDDDVWFFFVSHAAARSANHHNKQ